MPSLYVFVVCEKVVIDKNEVASLISLFTTMTLGIAPGHTAPKDIPANAVVPKEWVIFSSWVWEAGDEGKQYKQGIEILFPDHTVFIKTETPFVMTPNKKAQINAPINGFPVGQEGFCTVRMWLEHEGNTIFEPLPIALEVKHPAKNPTT